MTAPKKTAPKKSTVKTSKPKAKGNFVEDVLGYDGKDDGMRPLRMSIILATLLSILVVSIITYFVGGEYPY